MEPKPWSAEKAAAWYARQPWLRGCNFIPSNAINQLEMWQAETFDPETIARELGWAAGLGFNAVRVYLHDLLWLPDGRGFKERLERYLDLAGRHRLRTLFVLFDDCWHDNPRLGPQPKPRPGIHNSGWLKSPGTQVLKSPSEWNRLQDYVSDIISTFGADERVLLWDLYNEPGNSFLTTLSLPAIQRSAQTLVQLFKHRFLTQPTARLLRQAFVWARAARPSQPLTTGLYYLTPSLGARLNPLAAGLSDIITFHSYFKLSDTARTVDALRPYGRPLICTEYLARRAHNTFQTHLGYFKEQRIGAINWGLVSGKTQTMYSWEDYDPAGGEPPVWYHDILRPDGSPYRPQEVEYIRQVTGASGGLSNAV